MFEVECDRSGFCHAKAARKHRKQGHYVRFAFLSVHGRPVYQWIVTA